MPELAQLQLLALTTLLVKHTVADFFLQTRFQHANKSRYLHPGGLLHAFIHVLLTLPVFAVFPVAPELAIALLSAEFVVHYHVDFVKARVTEGQGWTPTQAAFWHAFGLDQLAHGLTYVVMLAVLTMNAIEPIDLGVWAPWPLRN